MLEEVLYSTLTGIVSSSTSSCTGRRYFWDIYSFNGRATSLPRCGFLLGYMGMLCCWFMLICEHWFLLDCKVCCASIVDHLRFVFKWASCLSVKICIILGLVWIILVKLKYQVFKYRYCDYKHFIYIHMEFFTALYILNKS